MTAAEFRRELENLIRAGDEAERTAAALRAAEDTIREAKCRIRELEEELSVLRPGDVVESLGTWSYRCRIDPSTLLYREVGVEGVINRSLEECRRQLYDFAGKQNLL